MAKREFPGPISAALINDNSVYYATTTAGSRICVNEREGAIITDHDGFKFIDFHCDASVNNLGGNHPVINNALLKCVESGNLFSEHHNSPNAFAVELAQALTEKSPVPRPAKVYFANSGAEANETAIKLCKACRFVRGERYRRRAIYCANAFHGRTLGILPGTNSKPEVQRDPFWNSFDRENTLYVPYPGVGTSLDANKYFDALLVEMLRRCHYSEIDRIMIELPCQGEGGIIPADEKKVGQLYEFAKQNDILFIVDAIQCGMGRAGSLFGCDLWPWLEPDIITLGKALGGGIPIGATIFRAHLDFRKNGMHSSTFGGGPLATSLGLAVLSETESLIASTKLIYLAATLKINLNAIQNKFPNLIRETRGLGVMWAHEISSIETRDLIIERCEEIAAEEEYGLRLLSAGKSAIRFMPPLNIPDNFLKLGLSLYEKVLSTV